jgi:hypothetical protein
MRQALAKAPLHRGCDGNNDPLQSSLLDWVHRPTPATMLAVGDSGVGQVCVCNV